MNKRPDNIRMHGTTVQVVPYMSRKTYTLHEDQTEFCINPLKPELNPISSLLALLAHHFLHVSRIRVKSLILR